MEIEKKAKEFSGHNIFGSSTMPVLTSIIIDNRYDCFKARVE